MAGRVSDQIEDARATFVGRIRRVAPMRRRAVFHGALVGGSLGFLYLLSRGTDPFAWDACAYWMVDLNSPYDNTWLLTTETCGFFNYSPAAALAIAPFGSLPWPVFAAAWTGLLLLTLVWLGGRAAIFMLAFPPIAADIWTGNINLLLGAAIVLGFRHPAAWAFVLLTKITPGIGLVWFLVRREWRALFIALGATVLIVAGTWLILPEQWGTWLTQLRSNAGTVPELVPLWLRVGIAGCVIAWGATKNAPWTVPVGAVIAMPVLYMISFAVLAACWPLRRGLPAVTQGALAAPAVAASRAGGDAISAPASGGAPARTQDVAR